MPSTSDHDPMVLLQTISDGPSEDNLVTVAANMDGFTEAERATIERLDLVSAEEVMMDNGNVDDETQITLREIRKR